MTQSISDVKWKSIYSLRYKELYKDLLIYYTKNKLPKKSNQVLYRFKKYLEIFKYDEPNLYLIANNLPDENLKGIVELPIKLILLNPENKKEISKIISEIYNSSLAGAYRGVETIFQKIRQSYLGISRRDVADTLKRMELKQFQRQPLIKELIPIIKLKPLEQVQIDLIDVSEWANNNE